MLFMGYAFSGKDIYKLMIIIFLYSLFSIWKNVNIVYDFIAYVIGLVYIFYEFKRYILEYGITVDDHSVPYFLTLVAFLLAIIFLFLNKKKSKIVKNRSAGDDNKHQN